jgi:hypothetical protein
VKFTAANSSVTIPNLFTLMMVDPMSVDRKAADPIIRHWLVNNVTLGSDGTLSIPQTTITAYIGSTNRNVDADH